MLACLRALQIKLDELIFGLERASNQNAVAENMSGDNRKRLHRRHQERAETALESLKQRRLLQGANTEVA